MCLRTCKELDNIKMFFVIREPNLHLPEFINSFMHINIAEEDVQPIAESGYNNRG